MNGDTYTIAEESPPEPRDAERLLTGLVASDPPGVPPRDYAPLAVVLRGPGGALAGGLTGATMWGWLMVDTLWVEPRLHGGGHGARLLAAAEAAARARGCAQARLDTFDFQARGFYERHGYVVYGQLDGFPAGHVHYDMRKALRPVGGPAA